MTVTIPLPQEQDSVPHVHLPNTADTLVPSPNGEFVNAAPRYERLLSTNELYAALFAHSSQPLKCLTRYAYVLRSYFLPSRADGANDMCCEESRTNPVNHCAPM